MKTGKRLARYRIDNPKRFRLASFDPGDTGGIKLDKDDGEDDPGRRREAARRAAGGLYAQGQWALLVVLQGLDTAGKDGVIEHVMSGVNPQGCEVHSFKAPSPRSSTHDFLWRARHARCRSAVTSASSIAPTTKKCWWCGSIRSCWSAEAAAASWSARTSGRSASRTSAPSSAIWPAAARSCSSSFCTSRKEEQRKRLLDRLEEPAKRWKFSMGDIAERKLWDKYMAAYEDMIRSTSTARGAVVRGAGRPQMVHAAGGGWRRGGGDREARSAAAGGARARPWTS